MPAIRSLDDVICRLSKVFYISKACSQTEKYKFGINGSKLRDNLFQRFCSEQPAFARIKSEENVLKELKQNTCPMITSSHFENKSFFENFGTSANFIKDADNHVQAWQIIDNEENKAFAYQDFFRKRRMFWKRFMFNNDQISVKEEGQSGIISATLEDFTNKIDSFELESFEMVQSDLEKKDCTVFLSKLDFNAGAITILLDSMRYRQFLESPRLALPPKIAPYSVGIMKFFNGSESKETKAKITDLKNYIEILLKNENISVRKEPNLQGFDDIGVPYVIVITEESLQRGILRIRDRDTNWHEQIHLAHLIPRMVNVFQDRSIPNTFESLKQKYKL